jgi:hypothetical protein
MRVKRIFATTILALALAATPASAQTLGELGGTMGLTDTLAGTGYPTIQAPEVCSTTTLPDLDADGNVIPRETTCTTATQPQTTTQAPPATEPAPTARANGFYCKGQSRKRVAGQRGTAFSRCVTAMAKLRRGATSSPATACKGLKRSAFSRCVSGGRRLLADLR